MKILLKMLSIKKLVLRLSMTCGITFLVHHVVQARSKLISLQEAIHIALKDNVSIQIAENTKKGAILSSKIDNFCLWIPHAAVRVFYENSWKSGYKKFSQKSGSESDVIQSNIRYAPVFALQWEFSSLFDKIFRTKINCQNNVIYKLTAKKSVEKILQQVVTAYYELALAQKKWELSSQFVKLTAARLKAEEEKLRVGRASKVDFLDAQLALKQVKLNLLDRKEALNRKRWDLNLLLGKPLHEETLVQSVISVKPIWNIKSITKKKVVDLDEVIQEKKVSIAGIELSRAKSYPLSCLSLVGSFRSNGYLYDLRDKKWYLDHKSSKWFGNIGMNMDVAALLLMPAKVKQARIAFNKASCKLQQLKLALENNLEDKKCQYHHALDAYKVAEDQLKISKQRLVFMKEKYRLKQIKLFELHEAEEVTQKAEISAVEHACKVKQAEFDLYRLGWYFSPEFSLERSQINIPDL